MTEPRTDARRLFWTEAVIVAAFWVYAAIQVFRGSFAELIAVACATVFLAGLFVSTWRAGHRVDARNPPPPAS